MQTIECGFTMKLVRDMTITYKQYCYFQEIQLLQFMKNMNMAIWVIDTLNQLFITGSYTEFKLLKKVK